MFTYIKKRNGLYTLVKESVICRSKGSTRRVPPVLGVLKSLLTLTDSCYTVGPLSSSWYIFTVPSVVVPDLVTRLYIL